MRQQFFYFLLLLGIIPFLPFLAWQGRRLKKNLVRLPEADQLSGQTSIGKPQLSILVFGESSFAGVGVACNEVGIAGYLAKSLAQSANKIVHWDVVAKSGYSAEKAGRLLVPEIPNKKYNLIFVGLGANEAFEVNAPLTFRKNLKECLKKIRAKQPNVPIILSDMPPVGDFVALPFFIRKTLGVLIRLHGNVIADFPEFFNQLSYRNQKITFESWHLKAGKEVALTDFFCEDGIHPSEMTYRIWAEELAETVSEV